MRTTFPVDVLSTMDRSAPTPLPSAAQPAAEALMKLLYRLGLIGRSQLTTRFLDTDPAPIAFFARMGCYSEAEALQRVARELSLQVVTIDRNTEREILKLLETPPAATVPAAEWRRFRAVPISVRDGTLTVALANPFDLEALRQLQFETSCVIQPALAAEEGIIGALSRKLSDGESLDLSTFIHSAEPLALKTPEGETLESNITEENVSASTVTKVVNRIFSGAIRRGASDIHIMPQRDRLLIRVRVDGIAQDFAELPRIYTAPVLSRIKVLCGMDISEKRKPQDGRLRLKTNNGTRDLRISTVPTAYGEDLVARILESEFRQTSFSSLGMSDELITQFEAALSRSSKVVLVTGPTGSGKTTTLYAAVLHVRGQHQRIITIEDPIEYRISDISQIQVNPRIDMSFAQALRSVLRQDPDIIYVGEIRDLETAEVAAQAAQTGHLVLSTLHTNTAAGAITRLRDLGLPPYIIAASLGSVLAQRLVRRLCQKCCAPLEGAHREHALRLGLEPSLLRGPRGCDDCNQQGYRGRIGVYSYLEVTPTVAKAIRDQASEEEIEELARPTGFWKLEEAAMTLLMNQTTSLSEVERVFGALEPRRGVPYPVTGHPKLVPAAPPYLEPRSTDHQATIARRRVLIVDDDENIRELFKTLLEFEMFDVISAANGHEALTLLYEQPPEIVLLDLMMPKMNGEEFLNRIRQDARTREIPVIVLTATATEDRELDLLKHGADDFISKTARPEVIIARMNRLLNRI